MNITIKHLLSNSFVISINKNRLADFYDIFSRAGLDTPLPQHYQGYQLPNGIFKEAGIIKSNNILNCTLTHISLILMAKCIGMEFICIFEDDAYPRLKIDHILSDYLNDIPDETDILKLGHIGYTGKWIKKYNNKFSIADITYGTHAYIVFKKYYDNFLKNINKDLKADGNSINSHGIISLIPNDNLFIQYTKYNGIHYDQPLQTEIKYYGKQLIQEKFGILQ